MAKRNDTKVFAHQLPQLDGFEDLHHDNLDKQLAAMHSIAARKNTDAIPALIHKLNTDDQWTRLGAIYTLGAIGSARSRASNRSSIEYCRYASRRGPRTLIVE